MSTTSTTSPHGAVTCAEPEASESVVTDGPAEATTEVEARRRWLATAAWPEVAFATA